MLHNPYKIVQMFEEELAHYTGAPFAVSMNSCTNALFLAGKWLDVKDKEVIINVQNSVTTIYKTVWPCSKCLGKNIS